MTDDRKTKAQMKIEELVERCIELDQAYFLDIVVERYEKLVY